MLDQARGIPYLLRHHHDKAVILNRVLSESLRIIIHDLSVGDQLLCLSCVAMSGLNLLLQIGDL